MGTWSKSWQATLKNFSVNPKTNCTPLEKFAQFNNPDTSEGFLILLLPEHSKISDQIATTLIVKLSLTLYGYQEIRYQNKQSTIILSSILKYLTLHLKWRSTTRNHVSSSGKAPGPLLHHPRNFHIWTPQAQKFEAEIHPLFRLIMPNIQGLHGDQEDLVEGGKWFHIRTGEVNVPEEVKQPPHLRGLVRQEYQGFSDPSSSSSGPKASRWLQ